MSESKKRATAYWKENVVIFIYSFYPFGLWYPLGAGILF